MLKIRLFGEFYIIFQDLLFSFILNQLFLMYHALYLLNKLSKLSSSTIKHLSLQHAPSYSFCKIEHHIIIYNCGNQQTNSSYLVHQF